MTPVSDSDLSNVTGQAGVNINADLTMNIGIGTMAWGDASGADAYNVGTIGVNVMPAGGTSAGYVGITDFNITGLNIKARTTDTYGSGYYTGVSPAGTYVNSFLKPITIDVATGDKTAAGGTTTTTYVRFGLGSLQITLNAMSFNVALGTAATAMTQNMGTANLGAIGIYINPKSYVDIFAHAGSGVSIDMAITLDQFNMSYISWGDTDGLVASNVDTANTAVTWISSVSDSAGYIGLQNLSIGAPITINGTVAIDVVTMALGAYSTHLGGLPVTVCHISFPRLFNVNVHGPITANVKLDSVAALSAASNSTLGDIYISGFNLDIAGGSWVDIWAH